MFSEYNDYEGEDSTVEYCTLALFLKKEVNIISPHDGGDIYKSDDSPEWCPLKEEKFEFEYKKYSTKRLKEINDVKEKIIKLSTEMDNDDDIFLEDERYDEINKLNIELDNLYNSEDFNIEDFKTELNNSVKEINDQLNSLLKDTDKLNDVFNNLGDDED